MRLFTADGTLFRSSKRFSNSSSMRLLTRFLKETKFAQTNRVQACLIVSRMELWFGFSFFLRSQVMNQRRVQARKSARKIQWGQKYRGFGASKATFRSNCTIQGFVLCFIHRVATPKFTLDLDDSGSSLWKLLKLKHCTIERRLAKPFFIRNVRNVSCVHQQASLECERYKGEAIKWNRLRSESRTRWMQVSCVCRTELANWFRNGVNCERVTNFAPFGLIYLRNFACNCRRREKVKENSQEKCGIAWDKSCEWCKTSLLVFRI